MNKGNQRNLFIWLVILVLMLGLPSLFSGDMDDKKEIIFSEFLNRIDSGEMQSVEIKNENIKGKMKNGDEFSTLATDYPKLIDRLNEKNVEIKVLPEVSKMEMFGAMFVSWFPVLFIMVLLFYFFKNAGGGANGAFKFGKSKAKMLQMKGKITFKDVAGINEAKEELAELVDFLKEPYKYTKIGAKIPRGCLLVGEPGTGKTLLARAIAGEADVPFFFISGSDFVEMFVGVGASRVRDMFEEAKKNAPCLIFIDEIDAVGRHRGVGIGGGNDEREQTLNQLLVEMDGFEGNEGIIVIAATNRPDVLDKALMRPGRFDRQIMVNLPDYKGREEILAVHAKKVQLASDVDLAVIAKATPGFSGAQLANLVNEAAILAARNNRKRITMEEMEEATDKISMGMANKSKVVKEEERKITAYHEAGHTIVALNCKNVDPLHKVTIIPRGHAGGFTAFLPESESYYLKNKTQLLEQISVSMGGRVAEELIFGADKITGGAAGDIQNATKIAEAMITVFGFSDVLGTVNYERKRNGGEYYQLEGSSDKTLDMIDSEVKQIVSQQKKKAEDILKKKKKDLIALAEALLKHETLDREQVEKVLRGEKIEEPEEKVDYTKTNFSMFTPMFEGDGEKKTRKRTTKKSDELVEKKETKRKIAKKVKENVKEEVKKRGRKRKIDIDKK